MVMADSAARRYFPPQFADELSARYFAQYIFFDPRIPLKARQLSAASGALGIAAFAGFAAVAYRAGVPAIAGLLLFACAMGTANFFWQWHRSKR